MRVAFTQAGGVRTRYLTEGTGPALLLLHPVGHVDALAANHTVVAPDLPGHGFSDPIDFKGRPPQVETVAHLRRLVDALGRSRFAVLGSSYGGLLAALLCEAEQARCFGLVIVGVLLALIGTVLFFATDLIEHLMLRWHVSRRRLGSLVPAQSASEIS